MQHPHVKPVAPGSQTTPSTIFEPLTRPVSLIGFVSGIRRDGVGAARPVDRDVRAAGTRPTVLHVASLIESLPKHDSVRTCKSRRPRHAPSEPRPSASGFPPEVWPAVTAQPRHLFVLQRACPRSCLISHRPRPPPTAQSRPLIRAMQTRRGFAIFLRGVCGPISSHPAPATPACPPTAGTAG